MNRVTPTAPDDTRDSTLEALRRQIAGIERPAAQFGADGEDNTSPLPWRFGCEEADAVLPPAGLAVAGLHEAAGDDHRDGPAASSFALALLRRLRHRDGRDTVLVCQSGKAEYRFGSLYGHGLADRGLDPDHILFVTIHHDRDVLWAVEEGLASGALAAVVGEVDTMTFAASRRLSLAAQDTGTPALLLRADGLGPASAAMTRWRVSTRPGAPDALDRRAPGDPCWRLDLVRCRGGRPATLDLEWNRETGDFRLAAPLAGRPAAPRAQDPAEVIDLALRQAG